MKPTIVDRYRAEDTLIIAKSSSGSYPIDIPPQRLREVDTAKVDEIKNSILLHTQLNPIVVAKERNGRYTLVAGLHRLLAVRKIWDGDLDTAQGGPDRAVLLRMTAQLIDESDRSMIELTENLARNDLNRNERKRLAGLYGSMLLDREVNNEVSLTPDNEVSLSPDNDSQQPPPPRKPGGTRASWFSKWYTGANVNKKTAGRYWQAFAKEAGVTGTPAKNEDHAGNFFKWLETNSEEALEESRQTAEEAKKKRRADAIAKLRAAVDRENNNYEFTAQEKKLIITPLD